jgi:hypothetical protein
VTTSAPEELTVWKAAAEARHYSYQSHILGPGLTGQMFRSGERVVATSLVNALQSHSPFLAGSVNGRYVGQDLAPRTLSASFVAIPLGRPVPNVVVHCRDLGVLRQAGIATDHHDPLELGGALDATFELLCPRGHELDALQIFTPDLLELVRISTDGCDIELVDEWMFIYSAPGRHSTEEALDGIEHVTRRVQARVSGQSVFDTDGITEQPTPTGSVRVVPGVSKREEREARAGVVARGRRFLDDQARYSQRLVLTAVASFVTGGLAWWFVSDVLPTL